MGKVLWVRTQFEWRDLEGVSFIIRGVFKASLCRKVQVRMMVHGDGRETTGEA
jgi:hypothetical protein